MFVVDTNLLVYAANQHAPESDRCLALLEEWSRQTGAWFVTWSICYEFLRTTTHPRVLRSPWTVPQAFTFLEELFAAPGLSILTPTGRHAAVLAQTINELPDISGNRMHDMHIAVLMREHGVHRIYTRDTDFHRFPFLEPIDPLTRGI